MGIQVRVLAKREHRDAHSGAHQILSVLLPSASRCLFIVFLRLPFCTISTVMLLRRSHPQWRLRSLLLLYSRNLIRGFGLEWDGQKGTIRTIYH